MNKKSFIKDAIISFVVIPMCAILLLFAGVVFFSNDDVVDISDGYVEMCYYTADKYKYLGKNGRDKETAETLGSIYSLDGLPNQYVLYSKYSPISNYSSVYLYMKNSTEEPILRYDLSEIKIRIDNREIVIKDKTVISQILSMRREGVSTQCTEIKDLNTTLYFDLRCNMSMKCHIIRDENNRMIIICFDVKKGCWKSYDLGAVLQDIV
jgi:hypothetical protein